MAEPTPTSPLATPGAAVPAKEMPRVIVRAYPKIIFFWLTWIASLVAGILQKDNPGVAHLGTVWLCIFAFNLLIISFDFTEVISVLVIALVAVFVFA